MLIVIHIFRDIFVSRIEVVTVKIAVLCCQLKKVDASININRFGPILPMGYKIRFGTLYRKMDIHFKYKNKIDFFFILV